MYGNLKGKRLLVVGSDPLSANIVTTAKELGVYVIVVDGNPKSEKTPGKMIADESWDIDYSETSVIGDKCIQNHVDGVLASYSEFRVMAACKISQYIGTPFYANEYQIDLTRNKKKFKCECRKYGVPVPNDYTLESDIRFPVIVKPADYAGRKGISICYNQNELEIAFEYARRFSVTDTVVIEDYLIGDEISATYTIKDGAVSLSTTLDKYIDVSQEKKSGLCDLAIAPSKWISEYVKTIHPKIQGFLKGIGVLNGVAYFQGIANQDGITIFEMGFRMNGNSDYQYLEKENGISFLKMLISHSLTGNMGDDLLKDNPNLSRYYASLLLYAHAGTIAKYDLSRLGLIDTIYKVTQQAYCGKSIVEDGTTQQRIATIKFSAADIDGIKNIIKYIQMNAIVEDENNNSLLFAPFDADRIRV